MGTFVDVFVGRERELAELADALRDAQRRRGSLFLIRGEPGIGKSRLVEELLRRAEDLGFGVLSGRCWEVGGAPAYWPWTQVLRGLLRAHGEETLGDGGRRHLAPMLPELRGAEGDPQASLDPATGRFALLDAAVGALCDAADRAPLLVVLEDLHAADASSVLLLELLATSARSARVLVVGTYRDQEARRGPIGPLLARVERGARTLALSRLGREDVGQYLGALTGDGRVPREMVEALHRRSDGNALFMVETARWLLTHGGLGGASWAESSLVVPATLSAVLEERLADLPAEGRSVLEVAAVLGRDIDRPLLAELTGGADLAVLDRARDLALLVQTAPRRYRFRHILLREALYRGLGDARRRALHGAAADALAAAPAVRWSLVAHHLRRAGDGRRSDLVGAARRAAQQALAALAFDEATDHLEDALESLPETEERVRGELLLALGEARIRAGDPDGGRAACRSAAAIAERLDDPVAYARAALTYGTVFVIAQIDEELCALLERALAGLGPGQRELRARLLARLAGARQPAPDPEQPIALAREAIALAREVGDARTLLETLRSASSALMDVGDPAERRALNQEHVALARELGDPVEAWRGSMRLVFDHLEAGAETAAARALDDAEGSAARLDVPAYRWPVAAARAMLAMRRGELDAADAFAEEAARWAERSGDKSASARLLLQRCLRLRAARRTAEAAALLPELRVAFGQNRFGRWMLQTLEATALADQGRVAEARRHLDERTLEELTALGDVGLLDHVAELWPLLVDRVEHVRRIEAVLARRPLRYASWGQLGMWVGGPAAGSLARLARARGDLDEARRRYAEAKERLRAGRSPLLLARLGLEQAELLEAAGDRDAADAARREAVALARSLGATALIADLPEASATDGRATADGREAPADRRVEARPALPAAARATPVGPPADTVRLAQDGESWALSARGEVLRLKDTKGVRLLARLVAEPGRSFHCLDLESPTGSAADVDRGDAGEVIDDRARRAYRSRVLELREELAEAESWNDAGRAERLRGELEALEAELARAVGLGGRARRDKGAAERARVNVQRRLRDAVERITQLSPEVASLVRAHLRTGTYCVYDPAS